MLLKAARFPLALWSPVGTCAGVSESMFFLCGSLHSSRSALEIWMETFHFKFAFEQGRGGSPLTCPVNPNRFRCVLNQARPSGPVKKG